MKNTSKRYRISQDNDITVVKRNTIKSKYNKFNKKACNNKQLTILWNKLETLVLCFNVKITRRVGELDRELGRTIIISELTKQKNGWNNTGKFEYCKKRLSSQCNPTKYPPTSLNASCSKVLKILECSYEKLFSGKQWRKELNNLKIGKALVVMDIQLTLLYQSTSGNFSGV